ncbi:MAG: Two component response regulator with antiterminator output domain [Ilumatobacteraceae bacterium]|nr:Two component response regulator with antiterminator output domain [Ilumatobacteraceae bacterium]
MQNDPHAEVLRALGSFLVTEQSLGDTLTTVAHLSQQVVPAAQFVGLLLADEHGRPATRVFTDEAAPEIDQAQYDSDRGPCLDAWRRGRVVTLGDLTESDTRRRYPEFAAACAAHDIRSTVSVPVMSQGSSLGALNLYAPRPEAFTSDNEQALVSFADAAAVVMVNSYAYWGAFSLSEQLNEAMASRAEIEQAKGILMAGDPLLGPAEAFDMLRSASQRENVKLRDIARRIVERRPPPAPSPQDRP